MDTVTLPVCEEKGGGSKAPQEAQFQIVIPELASDVSDIVIKAC